MASNDRNVRNEVRPIQPVFKGKKRNDTSDDDSTFTAGDHKRCKLDPSNDSRETTPPLSQSEIVGTTTNTSLIRHVRSTATDTGHAVGVTSSPSSSQTSGSSSPGSTESIGLSTSRSTGSSSESDTKEASKLDLIRQSSIEVSIQPNASKWKAGPRKSMSGDEFTNSNVLELLSIRVVEKPIEELNAPCSTSSSSNGNSSTPWFHAYFLDCEANKLSFQASNMFANYLHAHLSFDICEAKLRGAQAEAVRVHLKSNLVNMSQDTVSERHSYRTRLTHGAYYIAPSDIKQVRFDNTFAQLKDDCGHFDELLQAIETRTLKKSKFEMLTTDFQDLEGPSWLQRLYAAREFVHHVYTYLTLQDRLAKEKFVHLFTLFATVAGFDFENGKNLHKSECYILGVCVSGITDLRCFEIQVPKLRTHIQDVRVMAVVEVKARIVKGTVNNIDISPDLLGQGIAEMLLDLEHSALKNNTCSGMICYLVECTQVRIGLLGIPIHLKSYIFQKTIPTAGIVRYREGSSGRKGELLISEPLDFMRRADRRRLWRFMLKLRKSLQAT